MAPDSPPPKIKLSRLRDIGWSLWDPIGLLSPERLWESDDCRAFADEYDSYLLEVADQLRRGASDAEVVGYLAQIEAEHMGLGTSDDTILRAHSVVNAIRADESLWSHTAR